MTVEEVVETPPAAEHAAVATLPAPEAVAGGDAALSAEADDLPPEGDAPEAVAPPEPPAPVSTKRWYVIKVVSNREESTKANIERKMKIEGLEHYFGQIVIPTEAVVEVKKVRETKNGEKITKEKRVTKHRKKFPGYIMAEVEWNAEVQTMLRDTNGVSDFLGSTGIGKAPPPMSDLDVQRMLHGTSGPTPDGTGTPSKSMKIDKVKLDFEKGDKVRIRDGAFANFEGEVKAITEPKEPGETPIITVEVQVLGRGTSIEMEFWQVDKI